MATIKFELDRLPDYASETLIAELRRVSDLVPGEFLSKSEFNARAKVSATTLTRRFGNWENALKSAGLGSRYLGATLTPKMKQQRGKYVSDDDLIAEMQRIAKELGLISLQIDEFNRLSVFEAGTVRRRFGTWNAAIQRAGLEVVPHGRRYTDDECFENLLRVWTHFERPPKYLEMKAAPSEVGPKAYMKRWGSWNKALEAFVERVNADVAETQSPIPVKEEAVISPESLPRTDERDRRDIRLGLRFEVLKRDRFKCILCGASPATSLEVRLHVDHIIPFSKGGKTEVANLRSLCEACNLGKGARLD